MHFFLHMHDLLLRVSAISSDKTWSVCIQNYVSFRLVSHVQLSNFDRKMQSVYYPSALHFEVGNRLGTVRSG